ncbi:MAG: TolC family protein [Magnetovibrio sp.]|nr:TolC family protein [Magnetovibrio sp.]
MSVELKFKAILLGTVLTFSLCGTAYAAGLSDTLSQLLVTHERIKAAQFDLDAARSNKGVAEGGYFPTISLTANVGNEKIYTQNPLTTPTQSSMAQREVDLSITQTLFDFGATAATVGGASLAINQAEVALMLAKQNLLLDTLTAQLDLASAVRILDYQTQSETSVQRQTELENARVQRGSGFSTDVLQAKTQLAGAQAARVRANGALRQAINRYRALFHSVPDDLNALELPSIMDSLIPESESIIVEKALADNPQIRASALLAKIANTEIARSFASGYRPVVAASAQQKYKRDVAGTLGKKNETLVKVEMTYDFNMGLTASSTLEASKSSHAAANSRLKYTRDQIEEQARNAWQNLQTARDNAEFLSNQANISSEFLGLARKERTLGQRSLIDVLAGETSLINAQAAADRASTDVAIAKLTVLNVMGILDLSVLQ